MKRSPKESDFNYTNFNNNSLSYNSSYTKYNNSNNKSASLISTNQNSDFAATFNSNDKYYKIVKSVLQENQLGKPMKFNTQDYSLTMRDYKYTLPRISRVKTFEVDLNAHKKSLNFGFQFTRSPNNYSVTKNFDQDAYKKYHKIKKEHTLPTIKKIKDLDKVKATDLHNVRENKETVRNYQNRERNCKIFNPPPEFNQMRQNENQYINERDGKSQEPQNNDNINKFGSETYKSDVFSFNSQVSPRFLKKSGERSCFFPSNKVYSSNSMSNSVWIPSHSNPSLFNHTNNEYHILNPLMKTISPVKSQVINDTNRHIISHRQKSFSEFIDITRNGSPNPNKDFVNVYKNYDFPFNRTKNVCSDFALMSHYNKDLCGPIFTTKKN